ncbi:MAG TPA: bifunctional [glutamate--ammonia ligase]-adenylyl-L-tyrosine phosphorylase/[glutamate--ammonia-ligase] adenylyltransferase [Rhodanobacteraceae bacterium]
MPALPDELEALVGARYDELVAGCRAAGVVMRDDAGVAERVQRTLVASDFAFDVFKRQPRLLGAVGLERLNTHADAAARIAALVLPEDEAGALLALRRFRHAEALRLVFRAVNELNTLADTLADTSVLYEVLLDKALAWAERATAARYGVVRDEAGRQQRLVVLGFGKLGGGELNFSSDIDLVFAYAESGVSDGRRSLDASEYFARLGRQLVRLMAEPQANGIAARVDLRLRPFGTAGRIALPFAAMEQYYQREGRDWERYAWIKARPVAGDVAGGRDLLAMLRPFIYRRYLDYTAFAGLREMKALIDAEVARKDLSANLKLGPGGIREIEFVVQLEQLIRGGREPSLRVRGLLPALSACQARGFLPAVRATRLREAYLFLRRLENRVQMLRDAQTHDVPDEPLARTRLALGMGYADWAALEADLATHRTAVSEEFAAVLRPEGGSTADAPALDAALWRAAESGELDVDALTAAGFDDAAALVDGLRQLPASAQVRAMSARGRARLHRLMPQLLAAAQATSAPGACLARLLRLVVAVARRSAYLALLEEQPQARRRLAELFADSAFLAECVIAQPLLLDDVLDPRIDQLPLKRTDVAAEITRAWAALDENDAEADLERLNELKASLAFRLGLAFRDGRANADATARRLAALAEAVVGAVLVLAERDLVARHGRLPGTGLGFAILGYGSLGGRELGFASDLDLVFVYDGERARQTSDGARPLDGARWYQRLAQRVMHWLDTPTRAGRLYEVDTRLRPDGSRSLLVTSLEAFATYEHERAWTWEHQALLRARVVAGDAQLGARLEAIRDEVLRMPREATKVGAEVARMRQRWRAERDRSDTTRLDLKQGPGALLDIEFLLQGLVLANAARVPALTLSGATPALVDACREAALLTAHQADALSRARALYLQRGLSCTLDARTRVSQRDDVLARHSAQVLAIAEACGYRFDAATENRPG